MRALTTYKISLHRSCWRISTTFSKVNNVPHQLPHLSTPIKGPYTFRHVLTHRIIMAQFAIVETEVKPTLPTDYIWVTERELNKYAISRLFELFQERMKG